MACAVNASCLGRNYGVSPKDGWIEPTILWHGDIRETGEGKSPLVHALCAEIYRQQGVETRRFEAEDESYRSLPRREREAKQPPRERGYFLSDLTVEGLRDDLRHHPTGGLLIIQDELSSFVSSQNQYKSGRGNDREAWLKLFDGKPIRVGRAGRSVSVTGARPSLLGGIQPVVFCMSFRGNDDIFLHDGTIYRFLFTYDRPTNYPLNATTWGEHHRKEWENVISRALYWSERQDKEVVAILDRQAQQCFFDWRNEIHEQRGIMHPLFRGFLPKAYGYALRLAGVIHAIHRFHAGEEPASVLSLADIERGIKAITFYLGQAVDAMRLLQDGSHKPVDHRVIVLAKALDTLRVEIDNGRLSVGFVMDEYNKSAAEHQQFRTPHAFGGFIRECGLTIGEGKYNANRRAKSKCLVWDSKTENFVAESLKSLQCLHTKLSCGLEQGDIQVSMSPKVSLDEPVPAGAETRETYENQCLPPGSRTTPSHGDNGDKGDISVGIWGFSSDSEVTFEIPDDAEVF